MNTNVISNEEKKVLLKQDCRTFQVLKLPINLYSEELSHGRNTVAELDGKFYYLGVDPPTLTAAIWAWQEVQGRLLTLEELKEVMIENSIGT
jgi:hypothetical protein